MKLSRRSLLFCLPILPANLAFCATAIAPLTQDGEYIAKVVEKAFGSFKEQDVLAEFIGMALEDSSLTHSISHRAGYSKEQVDELESRIAESFIIATNYLEFRALQDDHLKIRNRIQILGDKTAHSIRDPLYWTKD